MGRGAGGLKRRAARGVGTGVALFAVATGLACGEPDEIEAKGAVIDAQGHRGARGLRPENTLPGFELALELGVTTLELDLGLTRDDAVVVAHDPFINPATCLAPDGSRIEGERGPLLRDLTLAEVQAYDCGSLNPDPSRFLEPPRVNLPGTRIPTLSEVFALVKGRGGNVRFNVEIKARPDGVDTRPLEELVAAVVRVVRDAEVVSRTAIQAFPWRALALVKQIDPRITTVGLVAPDTLDSEWLGGLDPDGFPDFLSLLREAAHVDAFSPYWRLLTPGPSYLGHPVGEYQAAGFPVIPWTVNDAETMRELLALGVDGIISDYPDLLVQEIHRAGGTVERP